VKNILSPVHLYIPLRVRMLEGKPVIPEERQPLFRRDPEMGSLADGRGIGVFAVDQIGDVGVEVVNTDTGTLVGVSDRTSVLQGPFSGRRHPSVNAARAR
jgi:hypothetical protein